MDESLVLAMRTPIHERIQGCLYGGAIGDAVGEPYEGIADLLDVPIEQTWRLTDDTQLTLATCEAILEAGRVEPASIARQFCQWYQARRIRGLGSSTLKAIRDLLAGGHWATSGAAGEYAAGNGAAMRVAPLAFLLDPDDNLQRQLIRDVCFITHRHDEAYLGGLAVLRAIRLMAFAENNPGLHILSSIADQLPDSRVRDQLLALAELPLESPLTDVGRRYGNSGYVVKSVPLAIYSAQRITRQPFMGVLKEIVAAGGDTDTIAAMTGQIMGAYLGIQGLPDESIAQIAPLDGFAETVELFARDAASV